MAVWVRIGVAAAIVAVGLLISLGTGELKGAGYGAIIAAIWLAASEPRRD